MNARRAVFAAAVVCALLAAVPAHAVVRHDTCNVAGLWRGTGDDVQHTHWTFTLELSQQNTAVRGLFRWSDGRDRGFERVEGTVDCVAHQLAMHGVSLEQADSLALARYTLFLAPSYDRFAGAWTGGIPGTLEGRR